MSTSASEPRGRHLLRGRLSRSDAQPTETLDTPLLARAARAVVWRALDKLRAGRIEITDHGISKTLGSAATVEPRARMIITDPRAYIEIALRGSIGAGASYAAGYWSTTDLVGVLGLFADEQVSADIDGAHGALRLARVLRRPAQRIVEYLARNSPAGSRANIAAHYDLGNDFFELFLDPTMVYSCAVFDDPHTGLEAAQQSKLDDICRRLELEPTDHLLEIGTGWGSLAIWAARNHGCRVTTTTISREQYEYASKAVAEAGVSDRVQVLDSDYRDLDGTYDKLASIEMIEAVGHSYYDTFFRTLSERLAPDGLALLQAITIRDQLYDAARKNIDFITRYIFPGGQLPSQGEIANHLRRHTDMRIVGVTDITPHYAQTLRHWRRNLHTNADAIRTLGFDDDFLRLWEFYLAYCEAGFAVERIQDVQIVMAKPGFKQRLA